MSLEPANVHLQLRKSEATILLMAFDAGLVSLNAYQMTSELVFGHKQNNDQHKKLMDNLFKLQQELMKQIFKEKTVSPLITV